MASLVFLPAHPFLCQKCKNFPCSSHPWQLRRSSQIRGCVSQHQQHHHHQVSDLSFGRRDMAALGIGLLFLSTQGSAAGAEAVAAPGVFDKYIKRKKLDPLDTYVPPVLLSQLQFQDLEAKLQSDKPDFGDSRSYLRSGPSSSLRSNIRAVAQYASEAGDGQSAFAAVEQCISSLEELDALLLRASRNDSSASIQKMKDNIEAAVIALDRLLVTVPSTILEKCRAIAASYRESTLSPEPEKLDTDTKLLESLL